MSDHLLTSNDQKEELSRVYVSAVAAGAGYTTSVPTLDRDGVDVQIQAGGSMRPAIDIQLKATTNLGELIEGSYHFPLPIRNYNLLREQTIVPRILVVLDLPKSENDWLNISDTELIIRKCAFWTSLAEAKETSNQTSITVLLDVKKRFDVDGLKLLMDKSRTRSPL